MFSGESATETSGGAAGGSVWLDGESVTITGTITAHGGDGLNGGGGGGGMIAVKYTEGLIGGKLACYGGDGIEAGGGGPVYLENKNDLSSKVSLVAVFVLYYPSVCLTVFKQLTFHEIMAFNMPKLFDLSRANIHKHS